MIILQKIHWETMVRSKDIAYEHLLKPRHERTNQIWYVSGKLIK